MRPWQDWRARLNHDRLRNGLCLRLGRCHNILVGSVEIAEGDEWAPTDEECGAIFAEVARLIQTFSQEMSPQVLFDEPLLCHCDESILAWLPPIVHHLWLERFRVADLVAEAEHRLEAARQAHDRFQEARLSAGNSTGSPVLLQALESFQTELNALSLAVGCFPDRILPP